MRQAGAARAPSQELPLLLAGQGAGRLTKVAQGKKNKLHLLFHDKLQPKNHPSSKCVKGNLKLKEQQGHVQPLFTNDTVHCVFRTTRWSTRLRQRTRKRERRARSKSRKRRKTEWWTRRAGRQRLKATQAFASMLGQMAYRDNE